MCLAESYLQWFKFTIILYHSQVFIECLQGVFKVTEITLKKYNDVELASYNTQVAPSLQNTFPRIKNKNYFPKSNKSWYKPLLSRKKKYFYSKEYEINNDNSNKFPKTTKEIKSHFWSSYVVQPKWSHGWEYKQIINLLP